MKTYTLHVSLPGAGRVWRKIEVRADQTLEDLHFAIQDAFDFDADHLYSFFMSGKAWDQETEYCLPEGLDPYGFPIFGEEEWDDEEEEGWEGENGAVAGEATAESQAPLTPDEFALTLMRLIQEGKSVEEVKAEAYRLTGQSPETISPQDAQMLDNLLGMTQTLLNQVSLEDIEAFMAAGEGWREPGDVRFTTLESLNLKPKQEFMYLFDYGDEWRFKVRVHKINLDAPDEDEGEFPRVVEEVGQAPPQYPLWEDEGDEDWDEGAEDAEQDDDKDEA